MPSSCSAWSLSVASHGERRGLTDAGRGTARPDPRYATLTLSELLLAGLVVIVSVFIARYVRGVVRTTLEKRPNIDTHVPQTVARFTGWAIVLTGIVLALELALAEGLEDVVVDHPAARTCHEPLERIDAVGDGRIVLHVLLRPLPHGAQLLAAMEPWEHAPTAALPGAASLLAT